MPGDPVPVFQFDRHENLVAFSHTVCARGGHENVKAAPLDMDVADPTETHPMH